MKQKRFVALKEGIRGLWAERCADHVRVWVTSKDFRGPEIGDVLEGLLVSGVGLLSGVVVGKGMFFVVPEDRDVLELKDGKQCRGKVIEQGGQRVVLLLPLDGTEQEGKRRTLTATVAEIARLTVTEVPNCCYEFDLRFCRIVPAPRVSAKPGDSVKISIDGSIMRGKIGQDGKVVVPGIQQSIRPGAVLTILEVNGNPVQGVSESGAW